MYKSSESVRLVCMCLQTQSTMELKQKSTKSIPRRLFNREFIRGKNPFVKLGVKEVGVCLLEGDKYMVGVSN